MTEETITYCRVCEVYCGLVATVEDGRVTGLRPDDDHVASRGYICPKGAVFHEVTHDPDRVLHPLKRTEEGWQRISWEQAITEIAERLNRIRAAHGPHAVALYHGNPSGWSYSHRIFSAGWIDALGSRNVYGAGTQDNLALFLAASFLYGSSALRPIPDLLRTRYLLVVGANPVVSQGTIIQVVDTKGRLRAIRERGGKVVVIDPRRTETAQLATEHHFIRPDTDGLLLLAMIRTILEEGLEAPAFVERYVVGLDRLREVTAAFTPERVATRTGIAAETIRHLAREFAATPGACAYGRPVCGSFGTITAWALDVLNIVTGNLDARGGAVFSDGLVDLAGLAAKLGLDGYGRHRSRIGDHPSVLGELPSGVLADEITTPGDGQIRALVVTAGNPVLSIVHLLSTSLLSLRDRHGASTVVCPASAEHTAHAWEDCPDGRMPPGDPQRQRKDSKWEEHLGRSSESEPWQLPWGSGCWPPRRTPRSSYGPRSRSSPGRTPACRQHARPLATPAGTASRSGPAWATWTRLASRLAHSVRRRSRLVGSRPKALLWCLLPPKAACRRSTSPVSP